MLRQADAGEAHGHEAGQRRRLEKSAAGGLDLLQNLQAPFSGQPANEACEWIPGRAMAMHRLPDGNERRQRIADNMQPQKSETMIAGNRPARRQIRHFAPTRRARQGRTWSGSEPKTSGPCRNACEPPRPDPQACGIALAEPGLRARQRLTVGLRGASQMKGGPAQHGGRDVAEALDRITPAAVGILMGFEPGESAGD